MTRTVIPLALITCAALQAADPSYTRDIEPIFLAHCSGCHMAKVKMGGLSLETYDGLMAGGSMGKVVAAGDGKASRLYLMIKGAATPAMPMNSTRLSSPEIDMIRQWIDAGAKPPVPGEVSARASSATTKSAAPSIPPSPGSQRRIYDLAFSPDGKLIALASFRKVRLHDESAEVKETEIGPMADAVRAIAFSRDGALLAAAGGLPARSGEVAIWDVRARKEILKIQGHADCIYSVAFSPDGKSLATASYDKLIKLWDVATGHEIRTLRDHIDAVYALAFTADGQRLISGSADRTVKIWNVTSGERLYTLSEAQDGINTVALDPSGRFVAAGGLDKTIRIWELGPSSARLTATLIAAEDAILKLAWSPDGKRLLSSSADKTVKLFQASDLTELHSWPMTDWAYGLAWAPDGHSFVAGRLDGSLEIAAVNDRNIASK